MIIFNVAYVGLLVYVHTTDVGVGARVKRRQNDDELHHAEEVSHTPSHHSKHCESHTMERLSGFYLCELHSNVGCGDVFLHCEFWGNSLKADMVYYMDRREWMRFAWLKTMIRRGVAK